MSRSSVKGLAVLTTAAVAALTLLVSTSANAQVNVNIYPDFDDNGSDITFSGPSHGEDNEDENGLNEDENGLNEDEDGLNEDGSDITSSGPVTSFTSPDIAFATNFGYDWQPNGGAPFGAEFLGCLTFPTDGVYTLTLDSDDGSYLFLNGSSTAFINNGGGHGPTQVSNSAFFAGGVAVPFRAVFFEDFGGASGIDLLVNGNLAPASFFVKADVPEPGAWAFGAIAVASVLGLVARRRKG